MFGGTKSREESVQLEYEYGKKVSFTFKKILEQDYTTLRKIYTIIERKNHQSLILARDVLQQMTKLRTEAAKKMEDKPVQLYVKKGQKVVFEPVYGMICKNGLGRESFFNMVEELKLTPNEPTE